MATLNTGQWGISPSTYTIPKPYGEIYSWKLYNRAKKAPAENTCAYTYYSMSTIRPTEDIPTVTCETKFTDELTYSLNKDVVQDIFYLQLQPDKILTPFSVGDWLKLDNAKAFALKFQEVLPLVKINQVITPAGDSNIVSRANGTYLILETPRNELLKDALSAFIDRYKNTNDTNVPDDLYVTCTAVKCTITDIMNWGWTGDPRDIRTLSNNKDNPEWCFEIVCMDSQSSRDASSTHGFAMIASTQWASLRAVKNVLEGAATGMVEKLSMQYNKDLGSRFWSFYSDLQDKIAIRTKNTFGPIEADNTESHHYTGGYVLLRNVRTIPIDPLVSDNPEKKRRVTISFRDNPGHPLKSMLSDNVMHSEVEDTQFEIVAGSLNDEIHAAPEIGIISESTDSLFVSRAKEQKSGIPIQSYRYNLQQDVRFRIQNASKGNDVQETIADLQAFDKPSMPFEHDLHAESTEQFEQEFSTFSRLLLQCLVATTKTKSFNEKATDFTPVPLAQDASFTNVLASANTNIMPILSNDGTTPSINAYTIDVSTPNKQSNFQSLVNDYNPWMHPTDNEYGACSTLLWQPCVEMATGIRKDAIGTESVENMLTTVTPFGNIGSECADLVDTINKKIMKKFKVKFKTKSLLLKQADSTLPPPEYTPMIIQYDMTCNEDMECTWSLGGSVSMITEAMEMALLFLQRTLVKDVSENENAMTKIIEREQKIQWDTYPTGIRTHDQCEASGFGRPTTEAVDLMESSTPGNQDFYKNRDYAYKEVVYADSAFSFKHLNAIEPGKDDSPINNNRWSGIYGIVNKQSVPNALEGKVVILKRSDANQTEPLNWLANPTKSIPTCTGLGVWQGEKEPTIHDIIKDRYRHYTGKKPNPIATRRELEQDVELNRAADHIGPKFNASEFAVKYIHPSIKADNLLKQQLPEFLVDSFVGWHFSNEKSLGRTVFALACGKFYNDITEFFNKLDPYNEELALDLMGTSHLTERKFIQLLKINIPKRSKVELISHPIAPAIVQVRGNGTSSLTTLCQIEGYAVKTSTYRLVESEIWGTLGNVLSELRNVPETAVIGCLGKRFLKCNSYRTKTYTIRQLLEMRPSCVVALSRLFVSLVVYDAVRRNTQTYRQKPSVAAGIFYRFNNLYLHFFYI